MRFTAISKLKPGMRVGQSIIGIPGAEKYVSGTILDATDIDFLDQKGLFGIYTMDKHPVEILSPKLMCECLEAINKVDINAMIRLSLDIANELSSRPVLLDFRSVRSYEDYLAHHSVCVAVYATIIGIKMGMTEVQLSALALAGLMHDIGYILLGQSFLLKKGTLSQEEYEQVKQHTKKGYDYVVSNDEIPDVVKEAILHHHENINGTGYPDAINANEISAFAKILHVADVYDAIMSKRPYKTGMSNIQAIEYLIGGKKMLFDERVVDIFVKVATAYPTGIEVRLTNGEVGLVIAQTEDNLRPIILIEERYTVVNLAKDLAYKSIAVVNDIEYEEQGETRKAIVQNLNAPKNDEDTGKKKILLIDDAYVSIAHTKLSLGDEYHIVTCTNGSSAKRMVKLLKPDLILMDYEMPDMDGVTAAMEVQELGYSIPIVFLTGNSDRETIYRCGRCGAADYILKPANPVYLRTRIEMALKNKDGKSYNIE